jgi:hypothetical protein
MSALPPKADIGSARRDVRFVPKADIARCSKIVRYSITLSASAKKFTGSSIPVAFAILRLITSL